MHVLAVVVVTAGQRADAPRLTEVMDRTLLPSWDDPLPGAELGEVEYEMTREMWEAWQVPVIASGTAM